MSTKLNPYISFKDNARQAMEFYKSVFGGKLTLNTFKEFDPNSTAGDLIMHAMLETDNGLTLMGSDILEGMGPPFQPGTNFTVSLSGENEAELRSYWDGLAAGGMVEVPLEKSPWGDTFGMLTDKFGTPWMVNIASPR
jgi:PhnB protein